MPSDLVALREVLLAPEQAALRQLQHRLDDPATRAAEIAEALPAALALSSTDSAALVEHLRPLIRDALADALKQRPELLAQGCHEALRKSVRNPFGTVARVAGRMFRRRRRNAVESRIEQLYLVRQSDGELLEHIERPPAANDDPREVAYQNEQRTMRSMATYLLAALRDPRVLARYVLIKTLRVEQFVYGFHADDERVLLSVIHAGDRLPADQLMECDRILADASRASGTGSLLPPFASA